MRVDEAMRQAAELAAVRHRLELAVLALPELAALIALRDRQRAQQRAESEQDGE